MSTFKAEYRSLDSLPKYISATFKHAKLPEDRQEIKASHPLLSLS